MNDDEKVIKNGGYIEYTEGTVEMPINPEEVNPFTPQKIVIAKGTLIVDLDGTVLHTDDEKPLPFAVEKINKAYDDGCMIVITTLRGNNYPATHPYSNFQTERTLKAIGLKYHHIIWNAPSPRTVINDDVCGHISHKPNGSWEEYEF